MMSEERKREIAEYNEFIRKARAVIYKILSILAFISCVCAMFSYTLTQTIVFGIITAVFLYLANQFYDN